MDETKDLAMENIDENVDTTTEELVEQDATPERTYTQSELNEIVGARLARSEAKMRKETERTYGGLMNVLRAGTGKEDVEELTNTFRDFYTQKGIQIPAEPTYSERDTEVLAKAEADEIIKSGFDEVVEEVDRLASKGLDNLNPREREVFRTLAEYRNKTERGNELSKIGVTKDVYESDEFKTFASKFSAGTPITEIYEIFNKMQPKKEFQTIGSMKSTQEAKVKDFYTAEEIARLTEADLADENVWNAVRRSMTGKA